MIENVADQSLQNKVDEIAKKLVSSFDNRPVEIYILFFVIIFLNLIF